MMDALDLMLHRESAVKLQAPGPGDDDLRRIFESAVRAPDHGALRPWHFVVIGSDQRGAFGEVMMDSLLRREPSASDAALQRERAKAFRAPTIIVVAAKLRQGSKIPEIEQIASAVAAAQTIMLAAPALGYGAVWKTGAVAYDPEVKTALGLQAEDAIVGFLYIGTNAGGGSAVARPDAREFVTTWGG
jgi:nitroreductase